MIGVSVLRPDLSVGWRLSSVTQVALVERWEGIGRWSLTVRNPDEAEALLGGDVVLDSDGVVLASGWWDTAEAEERDGLRWSLTGPVHTQALADIQAWPLPTAPVTAQTDAYDTRTGPAETAWLGLVSSNATRLGLGWSVPISQGRGASVTLNARMHSLLDLARNAFAADPDLSPEVVWEDRALVVRVRQGRDLTSSAKLSEAVGTVTSWKLRRAPAKTTRVVVGAGGEGAARAFREYRRPEWETPRIVETFRDRRDVPADSLTLETQLEQAAAERFAEAGPIGSLRVEVTDSPGMRYGVDYRVGDMVTAYPAGIEVVDRITEATLTVDADGGVRASMLVGHQDGDGAVRSEAVARSFDARLRLLERR